jgi:transcriptional regulator with XRE-family HTH domain
MMTYGDYLRTLRIISGKTQRQVSRISCSSQAMVSRWEQGKAVPNLCHLPGLARALDVSEYHLTLQGYKQFRDEYKRFYERVNDVCSIV